MRHLHTGRKLGVDAPHRRALLRSLTLALIEHDSIRTTPAKAKELRWFADRVVTLAKRGDLHSRRKMIQILGSAQTGTPGENRIRNAMTRVYSELVPRFKDRRGGYTQMLRLANRRVGDNAELCIMQYIPSSDKKDKPEKAGKKDKKIKAKSQAAPQDKTVKTKKAK